MPKSNGEIVGELLSRVERLELALTKICHVVAEFADVVEKALERKESDAEKTEPAPF